MRASFDIITIITIIFFYPLVSLAQSGIYQFEYIETIQNFSSPTGQVDIIVEPETYVPSFYKGKAEPTAGNPLRLIAVPSGLEETNLTYKWSINRNPSINTSQNIRVTAPYAENMLVSLRVTNPEGTLLAERDEYVTLSSPEIIFYENNSLRGISRIAIGSEHNLIGKEVLISTEPYFIGDINSPNLSVNWEVDGQDQTMVSDWKNVALSKPEDQAESVLINLNIRNNLNLSESTKEHFLLKFEI